MYAPIGPLFGIAMAQPQCEAEGIQYFPGKSTAKRMKKTLRKKREKEEKGGEKEMAGKGGGATASTASTVRTVRAGGSKKKNETKEEKERTAQIEFLDDRLIARSNDAQPTLPAQPSQPAQPVGSVGSVGSGGSVGSVHPDAVAISLAADAVDDADDESENPNDKSDDRPLVDISSASSPPTSSNHDTKEGSTEGLGAKGIEGDFSTAKKKNKKGGRVMNAPAAAARKGERGRRGGEGMRERVKYNPSNGSDMGSGDDQEDDEVSGGRFMTTFRELLGVSRFPNSHAFTFIQRAHESKGGKKSTVKVKMSIELLPIAVADAKPAGFGRSDPNAHPHLPKPTGRIAWTDLLDPFHACKLLLQNRYRKVRSDSDSDSGSDPNSDPNSNPTPTNHNTDPNLDAATPVVFFRQKESRI